MANENTLSSNQDSTLTPPVQRYAGRREMLLLGIYFAIVGIFLLQNTYSFWPPTNEVNTQDINSILREHTLKIQKVTDELDKIPQALRSPAVTKDTTPFVDVYESVKDLNSLNDSLLSYQKRVFAKRRVTVQFLGWSCEPFPVDKDQSLLLLVLIMGALGSWLHGVSSYLDFIGNRSFVSSWIPWYLMRPILGSLLAVVFYVAIRAGLFPNSTVGIEAINPFSIAALAGLVGLFTQRATKKLADVFDALFPSNQQEKDKDPLATKPLSATIVQMTPAQVQTGTTDLTVEVTGNNFTEKQQAFVNGKLRATTFIDPGKLEFDLHTDDVTNVGVLLVTVSDLTSNDDPGKAALLPVVAPPGPGAPVPPNVQPANSPANSNEASADDTN